MTSFISYINNAVIKSQVYYASHLRIIGQIMTVIPERFQTANIIANGKRIKRQKTIYKTLHKKRKIEHNEPIKTEVEIRCSGMVSSSFSTCGTSLR
jgi:hypothetical protein